MSHLHTKAYSILGLVLAGATSHGLDPSRLLAIQKGPMVLKPQLTVATTYADNINYREEDRIGDFLATISPGLSLQLGALDYNHATLTYFYDRIQHLDRSEFDANQHRIALRTRFQRSRFTLDGRDDIQFLSSPLSGGFSLQGQMVDRTTFADYYRLSYDLTDRTDIYGAITHWASDYQDDLPLYDSQTLIGTLGFGYKAFSRSFLFGEFYYGGTKNEVNLPAMADYPGVRFYGAFVGARGYFTEKLTGTVKGGYELREYGDNSASSGAPVAEVSLTQRFSEATVLTLAYTRRQYESVQFARSTYVSDSISANLSQQVGSDERLRAELQAAYMAATYEQNSQFARDRSDNLITSGLTITYDVKLWMRLFGGYSFEWLDSTEPAISDYTVNRVTMGVQLGY